MFLLTAFCLLLSGPRRHLTPWKQPPVVSRQGVALPASLSFLYYPLRPLRFALKWIGVVMKDAANLLGQCRRSARFQRLATPPGAAEFVHTTERR